MTDQLTNYLNTLMLLLMCHLIGDFVLQSSVMAEGKQPSSTNSIKSIWWLTAHGATHGFLVIIVTGIPSLGLAELIIHSIIDYGKCVNLYSFNTDQFLHFICKILWSSISISLAPITFSLLK
jgi:hypothetical protein